jgi:hypothetical protein
MFHFGEVVARLPLEKLLRVCRCVQGLQRRMECDCERISFVLKDVAILRLNDMSQDFMMAREQNRHGIGILLS